METCAVCAEGEARYRCKSCFRRTCSATCSTAHASTHDPEPRSQDEEEEDDDDDDEEGEEASSATGPHKERSSTRTINQEPGMSPNSNARAPTSPAPPPQSPERQQASKLRSAPLGERLAASTELKALLVEYPTLAPKLHNIYLAMTTGPGESGGGGGRGDGAPRQNGGREAGLSSAADRGLDKGMNWYLAMRESGSLHDQEGLLRFSKAVTRVYGAT